MYVEHNFFIGLRDIDFKNNLKIKSLLSFLEDVGGIHSNIVGYGLLDIPEKKRSWILLNWKVKILRRPKYAENLTVKTWSRALDKLYAYRDFEIFDEEGKIICIASSKWVLVDTEKLSIIKVEEAIKEAYTIEPRRVFDEEISKLVEPKTFDEACNIKITRDMIDVNGHVHNLNYIDFASQILPYEVMQNATNIEIMYKKEIKEFTNVKCFYTKTENEHFVTIKSEDEK